MILNLPTPLPLSLTLVPVLCLSLSLSLSVFLLFPGSILSEHGVARTRVPEARWRHSIRVPVLVI